MKAIVLGLLLVAVGAKTARADDVDSLNPFSKTFEQAKVIAVGKVVKVHHAARSTDVVQFRVSDLLKAKVTGGLKAGETLTILAPRGMFFENTTLLVLLEPFGGGPRFECFARITESDTDFEAKVRVMRQYLRLEDIKEPAERLVALRRLVLRNLENPDLWTHWNALRTLEKIVTEKASALRGSDVEQLGKLKAKLPPGEFKDRLGAAIAKLKKRTGVGRER